MINTAADLEKVLKLCRKHGVDEIDISGLKVKFGPLPRKAKDDEVEPEGPSDADKFILEQLGLGGNQ